MSDGRVDYSRRDGRRTIHLYDFDTGRSELKRNHRIYLSNFASELHNPRIVWRIVGLASRPAAVLSPARLASPTMRQTIRGLWSSLAKLER